MSDKARIHAMLNSLGVKNTAYWWAEQDGAFKVPSLPYAVYYETGETVQYADGKRWEAFTEYAIELWEAEPNKKLRDSLGAAVNAKFGAYSQYVRRVPSEQAVVTTYEFTVIPERG
ncbi:hypothetical protein [uncultured Olegusella sp.]|uniref:hypothetical protein n=1 Tax=uncultured Olegusella sp. TaxID=1979846 RepID=UPI002620D037|nr:hypothetical protein [uncultured Olegusella sp.]